MLESYVEELRSIRSAILELTADPAASLSISTPNGGSRTVSYFDLAKLHARENELMSRIAELYRHQQGLGGLSTSYHLYCG